MSRLCRGTRAHPGLRSSHASLAVRSGGPGTRWHIVNAGPDITDQIESVPAPPGTTTLKLRDNGYRVTGVTNLRTGRAISCAQSGGTLT
ncbi:hypothetical protein [Streptomyces sp. NPDC050485]|uniref:hypothetical protein n=1 Tax=Streptomyces sp. NPDC050485 TaxID=3365617 RepID=UPI00378D298B